jgi:hypothetical protein
MLLHQQTDLQLHASSQERANTDGRFEQSRVFDNVTVAPVLTPGWKNLAEDKARAAGAVLVSKGELFSRSDAISIHMGLSRGLIGATDIALMKPGAILINTSRGPIVDEAALIDAVESRRIIAALDVYDRQLWRKRAFINYCDGNSACAALVISSSSRFLPSGATAEKRLPTGR